MIRYWSQHIIIKFTFGYISLLPNYRQVFLKTLQESIFADICFFSYFHGFAEEPLNPQESIREKTHLVTTYFQEWIFIYQDNFEYFAEINVLVSIIFKISRKYDLTNESQIHNICENICNIFGHFCNFWSHMKHLMIATDEKFIPWYCVNTMLPWHYANTMLLWKYSEYVSTKIFKFVM